MTIFLGREGEYHIFNPRLIYQTAIAKEKKVCSKRIVHLNVESINNRFDRNQIKQKLNELEWENIQLAVLG